MTHDAAILKAREIASHVLALVAAPNDRSRRILSQPIRGSLVGLPFSGAEFL
jgi:hypothetical protein